MWNKLFIMCIFWKVKLVSLIFINIVLQILIEKKKSYFNTIPMSFYIILIFHTYTSSVKTNKSLEVIITFKIKTVIRYCNYISINLCIIKYDSETHKTWSQSVLCSEAYVYTMHNNQHFFINAFTFKIMHDTLVEWRNPTEYVKTITNIFI